MKIFTLFFAILLIGSASANFELGNVSHSIDLNYAPGANLSGWVNISLDDEPINSLFSLGYNNRIELLDLLSVNNFVKGDDYSCEPSDCDVDYESIPSSIGISKTFTLNEGDDITYGLRITGGTVGEISDFSMRVTSNANEWYSPQLYIDFFADDIIEWQSSQPSGNFGAKDYGCYNAPSSGSALLFDMPYCEKVSLSSSPNIKLGANVIENSGTGESVDFQMIVYQEDDYAYGDCIATAQGTGEISCMPENFQILNDGNYFVCMATSNQEDNQKYSINYETVNPCGFTNDYAGTYSRDFEIFARTGTFGEIGSFLLDGAEMINLGYYDSFLEDEIWSYLSNRYSRDCSDSEGCVIPIKITAGYGDDGNNENVGIMNPETILEKEHEITLSEISFAYTTDILEVSDTLYNLTQIPAKINSNFISLAFDNSGLVVPTEYGITSILLRLKGLQIFEEEVTIQRFPEIDFVTPTSTAAAVPTTFTVEVDVSDGENITSYEWNFGGNEFLTTSNNSAVYSYNSSGSFILSISVTDTQDLTSTKEFNITVDSPKTAVGSSLISKKADLQNIKLDIQSFTQFQKDSLDEIFNLEEIETSLNQIQSTYDSSTNNTQDSVYINLMQQLLEIGLPVSLEETNTANSILFYPLEENIDVQIVNNVAGGDYNSARESDYINSILYWGQENLETQISFAEITAYYDDFDEPALNTFKIEINQNNAGSNTYLFVEKIANLFFKEGLTVQESGNYEYVPLSGSSETIEFSTTSTFNFVDVPAFISPSLSELSLITNTPSEIETDNKWLIIGLIVILIALLAFGAFSFIRKMKKGKNEKNLFKNRGDFYNLMGYVGRMKRKGLGDGDIKQNLMKSKWGKNQVKYVIGKHSKKSVFEAPVDKIVKKIRRN